MDMRLYYEFSKKLGVNPLDPSTFFGLPPIRGNWFYVDPYAGSNSNDGSNPQLAVADIQTAYGLCTSGAGDGIVLLSAGTGTTSQTTSYLKQSLAWSKHGITVFGVSSATRLYGRARIANVEVTSTAVTTCSQTAHSILRTTGSWISDGWEVGMKGTLVDSESANNGATFTITALTATTMTVSETLSVQANTEATSTALTSYNPEMIVVSGSNNLFLNVHVGNFSSAATAVGCVKVTGNRNSFVNCHFIGAGHATPAATTGAYDLEISGGQENTFRGCTFGTDTIIRAATNGNIRFSNAVWRARFYDCEILSYSATSTKGAILSASATSWSGIILFDHCQFHNWTPNGITSLASLFIGTKPTSGALHLHEPGIVGYTATDSVTGNDMVYVSGYAVAAGAGGLATTT